MEELIQNTDNTQDLAQQAEDVSQEGKLQSEQAEEVTLSLKSQLVKDIVADFHRKGNLKSILVENRRDISDFDKTYHYPEHMVAEQYHMENFNMELLSWRYSGSKWVILQLHGGGYINALKNQYRTMAGLYSEVGKGAKVLTVDYRVAPEHPYPAALEDAYSAYQWLLEQGYSEQNIVVAGDSAGGGLALALCHFLKDKGEALPAGIIAMSPWTDLTASGASYQEKFDVDPVFGGSRDSMIFDSPYIGDEDPRNPYISPMFGSYEDFPPMLIQVGTSEILLSDSEVVAQKAKDAGVLVRLSEYSGMFHVFQLAGKMMRESRKAWVEIGRFLEIIGTEE
jgi:acetyl esterase/lipase